MTSLLHPALLLVPGFAAIARTSGSEALMQLKARETHAPGWNRLLNEEVPALAIAKAMQTQSAASVSGVDAIAACQSWQLPAAFRAPGPGRHELL